MTQDWTSFTLQIAIKTNLENAWHAWTTSHGMESWFLESCTFAEPGGQARHANDVVHPGDHYTFTWFLYDIPENGMIKQVVPKSLFQFTFAGDCLVDITLETKLGHVIVTLRQHNIPEDENSKFKIRIGCHEGWTFYLANLKSILEGGLDLREKIPGLRGINN